MAGKIEIQGIDKFIQDWQKATVEVDKNKQSLEGLLMTLVDVNNEYKKNDTVKQFIKRQEQVVIVSKEIDQQAEKLNASYKEQERIQKSLTREIAKSGETRSGNAKELTKNRVANQELNKELKLEAQLNRTVEGSLERLQKVNTQLRRERDKLNLSTEEGRKELIRYNSLIDKNSAIIKENKDAQTQQTQKLNASQKEQERIQKALAKEIAKTGEARSSNAKELTKNRVANQELNKELKLEAQLNRTVEGSLERLKKVNIELKRERDKVNITTEEGQKELLRLNSLIDKNTVLIKENTDAQTEQTLNVGNYSSAVEGLFPLFGRLQNSLGGIADNTDGLGRGLPAINALKSGIAGLTRAALAFIATPIGAAIAALSAIGLVTKQFFDYNEEISESIKLTQQLTGLSGRELGQFRAEVQAVSQVFDQDFNETLKAANALVQNGLADSFTEALDAIENGLVRGADSNGDYLAQLKQFAPQLDNAGFSLQEFNNLIIEGQKRGIFDDKLVDAIKEADLSLKEFTKTQQDAVSNAFGDEFAEQFGNDLANGILTTKDAIVLLGEEAEKNNLDFQELQQLTADVFKGAGEDAGGFQKVLEAINASISEENNQLSKLEQATLDLSEANRDLEKAKDAAFNSESAILFQKQLDVVITQIKTDFFEGISELRKGFTSLTRGIQSFLKPIRDLIGESPQLTIAFLSLKRVATDLSIPFKILRIFLIQVGAALNGIGAVISQVRSNIVSFINDIKQIDFSSGLIGTVKSLKDAVVELKDETFDLGEAYSEAYGKAIVASVTAKDEIVDVNNEITESLIRQIIVIDSTITKQELQGKSAEQLTKILANLKKAQDDLPEGTETTTRQRVETISTISSEGINQDEEASGLIPEELQKQFQDEFEVRTKAAQDRIDLAKDTAEKEKEILQEAFTSLGETLGISADSIRNIFDLIDGGFETTEEKVQAFGSVITDVFGAITAASNASIERRIENIEKEKDAALENASLTTEQKEFLEEKFNAKKAKLQRKQAENDKKLAILSAVINTATGVVKALASSAPPANFILAALVGALGAIQIGLIASQPIPEFAEGVIDSLYEGKAIKDEQGAELHFDKRGKLKDKGSNTGAKFTNVKKGDTIIPAPISKSILEDIGGFKNLTQSIVLNDLLPNIEQANQIVYNGITKDQMTDVMTSTLAKQTKVINRLDMNGYKRSIIKGSTITRMRNNPYGL